MLSVPSYLATELSVRAARSGDLHQLAALVDRCTPDTLYRRFHGASGRTVERELHRIAWPTPAHRSWVAVVDGEIRGTATIARSTSGATEIALLVEDSWFRRGIGRALCLTLLAHARAVRVPIVLAAVQADNDRAVRFLRGVAPAAQVRFAGGGELEVTIPTALQPAELGQQALAYTREAA
jgi:ribosomal protein S18 acetylase RimI-like enzyme